MNRQLLAASTLTTAIGLALAVQAPTDRAQLGTGSPRPCLERSQPAQLIEIGDQAFFRPRS